MPVGDAAERPEEVLEKIPPPELLDDEPVLDERAVREREAGVGFPEPPVGQEAARERAVGEDGHSVRAGPFEEAALRAPVEKRVLHLGGYHVDTGCGDLRQSPLVEVGDPDAIDLSLGLEGGEVPGAVRPPGRGKVPPVELHQIEALAPETREGAVDHPVHRAPIDPGERREIRHELGVDFDPRRASGAACGGGAREKGADHLLDPGVDVGAVEGDDPGLDEGGHVRHRPVGVHRAVVARELPSALDDARDPVPGAELHRPDRPHLLRSRHGVSRGPGGRGTALVSAWRNSRLPSREIRNRAPQCGSGHATSASVVIQSALAVSRCFAGRRGSRAASG